MRGWVSVWQRPELGIWETFAHEMQRGLLAASVAIGLEVLGEMLAADATVVAGPKGKHNKARSANWHRTESGSVSLGGRKVAVETRGCPLVR